MINKLYNLKKLQTNQQLLQKQQLLANIHTIDEELEITHKSLSTATVQVMGAINDFRILAIHKNTMKEHIIKLNQRKVYLLADVEKYNKIIIELNKETEQFKYIKEQQDKERFKKIIKAEEEAASEYVQAKWKAS